MPRCRSCQDEILWLKNSLSDKAAPIDKEPSPGGNVALLGGGYYCIIPEAERVGRDDLHKSHFATCRQPARHRKPR